MPTYDYRCPSGHDFEHFFRKISDAVAELACPVCGAVAQRRMSAGAGLLFKGSGFYLTDYGKNAHRTSAPSSGGGDSGGGSESASAKSNGAASEGGSSSAKSDGSSASGAKSETTKSGETKSSSTKPKGGDAT